MVAGARRRGLGAEGGHGGGRFQFIENSKAIPDCIAGELGELLSLAARRAAIASRRSCTANVLSPRPDVRPL